MDLPFEHLNLRRNPFGALDRDEKARLAVADVDEHVEWLKVAGRVVEFMGDHGCGKTTRLLAMRRAMPRAAYLRASEQSGGVEVPDRPVVLVDEAQFLDPAWYGELFSTDRSYAVSTHRTLVETYRSFGLEVRCVEVKQVSSETLGEIARRRIEASRRNSGAVPEIDESVLELLTQRHGDNLRAMFDELYMVFQRLDEPRCIDVEDLSQAGSVAICPDT